MIDEEFIEKFNNYISNYGMIMVDISNIEKYVKKYDIIVKEHHRNSFIGKGDFCFYNKDQDWFAPFYPSIDIMIKGNDKFWSLFEFAKQELEYNIISTDARCFINVYYENEFLKSLLNIKGNSKEEISLKIQMMGY